MSTIAFSVPHSLSQTEALKRIKALITETKREHRALVTDLKEKWDGSTGTFSFSAKGYAAHGTLQVSSSEVSLEGEIPWALSFLKGTIQKTLTDKARELLS